MLGLGACVDQLEPCAGARVAPGKRFTCPTPGWTDRGFDLFVPKTWDGYSPLPLIIDLHGGGGNRGAARRGACPGADTASPGCLDAVAGARGVAVVYPDGTSTPVVKGTRTWNAGGGTGDFHCVSGVACAGHVDDLDYVDDLVREIGLVIPVDPRRIYATGLSNGGAMSHRLACERSERFAAIAALGGANQHGQSGGACVGGTAILQIHGTADPCWRYEQSAQKCGPLPDEGVHVGVAESMEGWRLRNGCGPTPTSAALPDTDPQDGTTSTHLVWPGCGAATELIRIDGGGHTWPGGDPLLGEELVGKTARDFPANERIVEFFLAHAKPEP